MAIKNIWLSPPATSHISAVTGGKETTKAKIQRYSSELFGCDYRADSMTEEHCCTSDSLLMITIIGEKRQRDKGAH